MRELNFQELLSVSGGMAPLVRATLEVSKSVNSPAGRAIISGGAVGGGTHAMYNITAGNDITAEGMTGSIVAGMLGQRFGNTYMASFSGAAGGGLAERSVKGFNSVLKHDNQDKSGNNYGD